VTSIVAAIFLFVTGGPLRNELGVLLVGVAIISNNIIDSKNGYMFGRFFEVKQRLAPKTFTAWMRIRWVFAGFVILIGFIKLIHLIT